MKMPWEIAGTAPTWKPGDPPIGVKRRRMRIRKRRVKAAAGEPCPYCGEPMTNRQGRNGRKAPTRDHVVPRSRKGPSIPENLAICCRDCNEDKGSLTAEEYLAVREGRASRLDIMTPERRRWRKGITPEFDRAQAAGY